MKLGTVAIRNSLGAHRRVVVVGADGRLADATAARVALLERSLPAAVAKRVGEAQVPPDLIGIVAGGDQGLDWVREAVGFVADAGVEATAGGQAVFYLQADVEMLPPVPQPPAIFCATTWPDHLNANTAAKWPEPGSPIKGYYKGNPMSMAADGSVVPVPSYVDDDLDIECELAAIVGTGGRDLSPEEAVRAIAGYTLFNDISVRKRQLEEMKLGLGPTTGKDADGHNVLGPWLVTRDEVGDVGDLVMSLHVNGEEWSSANTSHMAWTLADVLSYASKDQTIHPGHVITSGSYGGGCAVQLRRETGDDRYRLWPGDAFELRASRLGVLRNRFAPR